MTEQQEKLCNLCGNSTIPTGETKFGKWSGEVPHGLIDAKVIAGYHSHHLLDMLQYTFSFCEECLRKLFIQCKIKPRINDMQFPSVLDGKSPLIEGEEWLWERDYEAWEYRMWEDAGGPHQAYLDKKCNRKKDCPNKAVYTVLISGEFTEHSVCEEHLDTWNSTCNAEFVTFISDVLKPFL